MDMNIIAIVVGSSLLFFGVLIWKAVWFIRKVNHAEEGEDSLGKEETGAAEEPQSPD